MQLAILLHAQTPADTRNSSKPTPFCLTRYFCVHYYYFTTAAVAKDSMTCTSTVTDSHWPQTRTHARTRTHTQLLNDLLSWDYLSELVPEETFTPSQPWGNEEGEGFAQMTRSTVWKLIPFIVLWKRELLDPIVEAHPLYSALKVRVVRSN